MDTGHQRSGKEIQWNTREEISTSIFTPKGALADIHGLELNHNNALLCNLQYFTFPIVLCLKLASKLKILC